MANWRSVGFFCIYFCCRICLAQEPPTLLAVTFESSSLAMSQDVLQEPNRLFLVRHFARWREVSVNGNESDFTHLIDRQTQEEALRNNSVDLSCVDERVQSTLQECGPEDLGVFDIDDMLFETKDPTFQTRYICSRDPALETFSRLFRVFAIQEKNKSDYISQISMRMIFQKRRLIEPCVAAIINSLQSRGMPIVALSSFSSGPYGCVRRLEEHRYQELFSAGIVLENVAAGVDEEALNAQYCSDMRGRLERRGAVALYRNILSASRQGKGFVLNRFIQFMQKKPRRVYFFDDVFENHESVWAALKRVHIPLTSFLYSGASELFSGCEIDLAVANKQYAYMREQDEYISYADARELVECEQISKNFLAQQAVSLQAPEGRFASEERMAQACTALVTQLLERTTCESEEADDESETASEPERSWRIRGLRSAPQTDDSCVLPGWHIDCAAEPETDVQELLQA